MCECVRLVRSEWPSAGGIHRVGMRRNVGYHLENGKPAWIEAMNEVVIAAMIEKRDAVDNIDAILDVEGLDMVQFGGGDYSVRAGLPWRYRDVDAAMVHITKSALKKGVWPRAELGSMAQTRRYLDLGVCDFNISQDVGILCRFHIAQEEFCRELGLR